MIRHIARHSAARRLVRLVLAAAVIAGPVVAAPTEASAVGCWGDWCSGRDPHAMGCDADAYTVNSVRIPGTYAYVENRWSPTCKTQWARVPASWGRSYPSAPRVVQSTGYTQSGVVNWNSTYAWTRMIYTPNHCVRAKWIGTPGSASTACW